MKIRKGFVSNSSSSSFMCDITGEVFGGFDYNLGDLEMADCVEGHEFLTSGYDEVESWITEAEDRHDARYSVPKELCPICNGRAKSRIVARLKNDMKRLNITEEDMA